MLHEEYALPNRPKNRSPPIRSCLMMSSQGSYQDQYPLLEKKTNPPYVSSPITPSGQPEEHRQFEAILNWKTQNARVQNRALERINTKVDIVAKQVKVNTTRVKNLSSQLDRMYANLKAIIAQLDADLMQMLRGRIYGPTFNQKKAEIR